MASVLKVDKLDPQSGTALEIGTSGDTISVPSGATLDISASTLTPPATMPASSAANLTNIPGANITGTIAAVSGANLTSLTATNLGSGTVPTARLGSGTASSSTVLYGDQTYKAEPGGGKVLQAVQANGVTYTIASTTDGVWSDTVITAAITPASTSNTIFVCWRTGIHVVDSSLMGFALRTKRAISGGATTDSASTVSPYGSGNTHSVFLMTTSTGGDFMTMATASGLDAPSASTEVTYTVGASPYGSPSTFEIGGMYSARWSMVLMEIDGT